MLVVKLNIVYSKLKYGTLEQCNLLSGFLGLYCIFSGNFILPGAKRLHGQRGTNDFFLNVVVFEDKYHFN